MEYWDVWLTCDVSLCLIFTMTCDTSLYFCSLQLTILYVIVSHIFTVTYSMTHHPIVYYNWYMICYCGSSSLTDMTCHYPIADYVWHVTRNCAPFSSVWLTCRNGTWSLRSKAAQRQYHQLQNPYRLKCCCHAVTGVDGDKSRMLNKQYS